LFSVAIDYSDNVLLYSRTVVRFYGLKLFFRTYHQAKVEQIESDLKATSSPVNRYDFLDKQLGAIKVLCLAKSWSDADLAREVNSFLKKRKIVASECHRAIFSKKFSEQRNALSKRSGFREEIERALESLSIANGIPWPHSKTILERVKRATEKIADATPNFKVIRHRMETLQYEIEIEELELAKRTKMLVKQALNLQKLRLSRTRDAHLTKFARESLIKMGGADLLAAQAAATEREFAQRERIDVIEILKQQKFRSFEGVGEEPHKLASKSRINLSKAKNSPQYEKLIAREKETAGLDELLAIRDSLISMMEQELAVPNEHRIFKPTRFQPLGVPIGQITIRRSEKIPKRPRKPKRK
jgi:hypothetical protein